MNQPTSQSHPSDRGSLLLDVLLGMAIFALVAIIGVLTSGYFRERAYEYGAISDAKKFGAQILGSKEYANSAALEPGAVTGGKLLGASAPLPAKNWNNIDDPVAEWGLSLSPGNSLTKWTTTTENFGFCVRHQTGPWAVFRSDRGGITAHGVSGVCPDIVFDDEDDDGSGGSAPGPTTTTPPATPTPEPAPTTPSPTAAPTTTTTTPIPVPANDECDTSVELAQPTSDGAFSTTGKQTNIGASDGNSVWFHTYAPVMAYMTYALEDPPSGTLTSGDRTLTVYQAPNTYTNNAPCPTNLTKLGEVAGDRPGFSFRSGVGNGNYWVRVSSLTSTASDFRIDLHFHRNQVVRDSFSSAEPIDVSANQIRIIDVWLQTSLWGTVETGEDKPAGTSTMWYRLNNYWSAVTPTHTVEVIAPTNGMKPIGAHTVEVFSGATSASSRGTLIASSSGVGASSVTFTGPANGGYFYVRVSSKSGHDSGAYRLRLTRVN